MDLGGAGGGIYFFSEESRGVYTVHIYTYICGIKISQYQKRHDEERDW